jgi:hypothetical protein
MTHHRCPMPAPSLPSFSRPPSPPFMPPVPCSHHLHPSSRQPHPRPHHHCCLRLPTCHHRPYSSHTLANSMFCPRPPPRPRQPKAVPSHLTAPSTHAATGTDAASSAPPVSDLADAARPQSHSSLTNGRHCNTQHLSDFSGSMLRISPLDCHLGPCALWE